jgi:hypothetical protein
MDDESRSMATILSEGGREMVRDLKTRVAGMELTPRSD